MTGGVHGAGVHAPVCVRVCACLCMPVDIRVYVRRFGDVLICVPFNYYSFIIYFDLQ